MPAAKAEEKRKFIITTRRVDKFNIIRKRVLLSPAICQKCGEDLLALNKIEEPWDDLAPAHQDAIKGAMKDHVTKTHTRAQALIVNEDEIAGAWLGEKRGGELKLNELPAESMTLKKIRARKGN